MSQCLPPSPFKPTPVLPLNFARQPDLSFKDNFLPRRKDHPWVRNNRHLLRAHHVLCYLTPLFHPVPTTVSFHKLLSFEETEVQGGKSFPQDCIARNWLSQYSLPICNRGCTPSSVTLYWPHSFVSKALKRSMPSAHLKRNNLRCAQKFSHGASCILV